MIAFELYKHSDHQYIFCRSTDLHLYPNDHRSGKKFIAAKIVSEDRTNYFADAGGRYIQQV
jgi:hypothetical protein